MRVICIESTTWAYSKNSKEIGTPSIKKGSIYHVINSFTGEQIRAMSENFKHAAQGIWYEFLELNGMHHSSRFLEIPDDDFEEGIQEEQIELDKELSK
jgi:hypothetical protein